MCCSVTCWKDRWSSGEFCLVLGKVRKCSFNLTFYFLYTCTCTFSFQRVLRIVGVITGSFYFVIVVICLFLYRQACRYLLIYVNFFLFLFSGFILRTALFEATSLSFDACLVVVTRVLALCRDGLKQMSDLPFPFLFNWRIHCDIRSWWPKISISSARVICRGWTVNTVLGRLDCQLRTLQQPRM